MTEPTHVYPLADLRDHDINASCWCRPYYDIEHNIYVHNSMDGREQFENGERKPS